MNKKHYFLIYFFALISFGIKATNPIELIKNFKVGIALDNIDVFSDSTIVSKFKFTISRNTVLKILQESRNEHDEFGQNQVYKWYRIKTDKNVLGWVFGDNFAVLLPKYQVKAVAQPLYRDIRHFGHKNGQSILWQAKIQGHDTGNNTRTMYRETYLVLSNEHGNSDIILIESKSNEGQKQLNNIQLLDLTKDGIPEIIIETSSVPNYSNLSNRFLEIYNFETASFKMIFTERMDLKYFSKEKSPSIAKFINISSNMIRIEYIDFYNKNIPEYKPNIIINPSTELGLQYIVKTYTWESHKKQFRELYKPVFVAPTAVCNTTTTLLSTTKFNGRLVKTIPYKTPFQVLKIHRKKILKMNRKTEETYFEILLADGTRGYVNERNVVFRTGQHQDMLNAFYKKNNLFFPVSFLKISHSNPMVKK